MARHVWSVLCESVLSNIEFGSFSLIDVAAELFVEGDFSEARNVTVPLSLSVATYWVRDGEADRTRGTTRVAIEAPDGMEVAESDEEDVDLATGPRVYSFIHLESMPFRGVGRYLMLVRYRENEQDEWRTCASVPVDVTALASAEP